MKKEQKSRQNGTRKPYTAGKASGKPYRSGTSDRKPRKSFTGKPFAGKDHTEGGQEQDRERKRPYGPRRTDSRKPYERKSFTGKSFAGKDHAKNAYLPHGKGAAARAKAAREATREAALEAKAEALQPKPGADGTIRLNKFIANSGRCSRREADTYIAAGVVTVNGEVITTMGYKVKPSDDVRFNGERLHHEQKVYILMNKPKGYVTTLSDPHADKTVMDLISEEKCRERVYPVGRLDKATTGVLLFTNDGELTEKLTHPSFNRKKIYQAGLDKNLSRADMEKMVTGIELEDGPAQVDQITYLDEDESSIGLEIHSGRNRIVRRMFEALGYKVKKLDRVYFAGLTKKNLKRGQWRFLDDKEITMLKMGAFE